MTGTSARENLADVCKYVSAMLPERPPLPEVDKLVVIDVGAGQGTYAEALAPIRDQIMLEAIECWGPSITKFDLVHKYDNVWQVDARTSMPIFNGADVVIFGDVLEHMTVHEAHLVWDRAYRANASVIVSVPNKPYPQGAIDGNHYEEHIILDPVNELIKDLPVPDDTWEYPITNTYVWNRKEESSV